ncbi:MAG: hypothetical protein ACE5JU_23920 [Candidatus Binatia bacterium]
MAIVTYKFDESYKLSRTLVVGGWVAEEKQWRRVGKLWQKAIAYENRSLPANRKISRYHAAKMNANEGEYKGWENEQYRKVRFTKKLLKIVSNGKMAAITCGIDLKAFFSVFKGNDPKDLSVPYVLCMKMLMVQIAKALQREPGAEHYRVALIHDHGDWDKQALEGYNALVDDVNWEHRHRFVSITPLTWRDDVGLQPADLIAYESMRWLDDHLWSGKDMRKPLKELTGMSEHIYGSYIDRGALELLKTEIEKKNQNEEAV